MRETELLLAKKMLFVKMQAKAIVKLLRNNGIHVGVIRGNGTTSPVGADNYTAHFAIEPLSSYRRVVANELYLNFKMDKKTGKKIDSILKKNGIAYTWSGDDSDCFIFPVNYDFTGETFIRYGSYDTETGILSHVYEHPHMVRMCYPDGAEKRNNIEFVELEVKIIKKIEKR